MNAAARLASQHIFSREYLFSLLLTRSQLAMLSLIVAGLLSALGVIYVTNATRLLNADLQHAVVEKQHLQVETGQLLLERSTWMMQARVQRIAETQLGMVVPDHKAVVIIRE